MDKLKKVGFSDVDIMGGFWAERQELNRKETVFAVQDRYEETGRFQAFKLLWKEGSSIPKPHFFWDSDVAKWLEGAAYIITKYPCSELEDKIEEVIDDIEANQDENGYFNIYHMICEPELQFKNRDHHELYCLGHLIEAAAAYFNATGKDRFLRLVDKYIDWVIKCFCEDKTAEFLTPGHEEIELALCKLYELKGDKKYLELAKFFLDNRHLDSNPLEHWANDKYYQSDIPVREMKEAEGHAVRACYLYAGMADVARLSGDEELLSACKALFEDMEKRKMYITGGIGSSHHGEAFTVDYDLPNDTAYAETCASIAFALFADRMKNIDINSKYADLVERQLYNGVLSGVSLDGKCFFYENPLEINLRDRGRHTSMRNAGERLPITQRVENFSCSCCPPNITRFLASLADTVFSYDEERVFVHQFMSCSAIINGGEVNIDTEYPSDGRVNINVAAMKGKKLYVRIPRWSDSLVSSKEYSVFNGYAVFDIDGDIYDVSLDYMMKPKFYAANPKVGVDGGKVALMFGPIVYCIEGVDNSYPLSDLRVNIKKIPVVEKDDFFGVPVLVGTGSITPVSKENNLYVPIEGIKRIETQIKFIPYFGFANRGEADMRVWINY